MGASWGRSFQAFLYREFRTPPMLCCSQRISSIATTFALMFSMSCLTIFSVGASEEYTLDGEPTGAEELIRWHLNRGRFDLAQENKRRRTKYNDVPDNSGPLAPHASLIAASRNHSNDMARKKKFQHATVRNSAYYDHEAQPNPWDRMVHEGYDYIAAAENIAWGQPNGLIAYENWWDSEGHRTLMYGSQYREAGVGIFKTAYTLGIGARSSSDVFFTGTVFKEKNKNKAYDAKEGVEGVIIRLERRDGENAWFDVSSVSGSFAIPISNLDDNKERVTVTLEWPGSKEQILSLPNADGTLTKLTMEPGSIQPIGCVEIERWSANIGFRDLQPVTSKTIVDNGETPISDNDASIPTRWLSPVQIGSFHNTRWLRWEAQEGFEYRLWTSSDLVNWVPLGEFSGSNQSHIGSIWKTGFYKIEARPIQ